MRAVSGAVLVQVLAGASAFGGAEAKVDAKKLVGKWEQAENKEKKQAHVVSEFAADGKFATTLGDVKYTGTYKLDGDKLTLTSKFGGDKEEVLKVTVKKLTDEALETENAEGDKRFFKRVK